MASPFSLYTALLLTILLSTTTQISSGVRFPNSGSSDKYKNDNNNEKNSATDVHDLLPEYGLPKGLLPDNVKSYSLSNDGSFEVQLQSTCYVQFDRPVYYDKTIKGKLSYGKVTDVSGIQAKKLFFWVSVTGIVVHPDRETIEFQVGFISEELSAKLFETVHSCNKNSLPQQPPLLTATTNNPVLQSI